MRSVIIVVEGQVVVEREMWVGSTRSGYCASLAWLVTWVVMIYDGLLTRGELWATSALLYMK